MQKLYSYSMVQNGGCSKSRSVTERSQSVFHMVFGRFGWLVQTEELHWNMLVKEKRRMR